MTAQPPPAEPAPLKVWDLPTRLFHWILVILIGVSWFCAENNLMRWHLLSGQAILSLLLFRIAWGLVGSQTARFTGFLRGPGAALGYVRGLLKGLAAPQVGHNPLGGWMVVALLLVLLFQVGTGLFSNDDVLTEGPLVHLVSKALSDRLTGLHHANFNLLLVLAGVHVAAAFYYLFVKRDNLILPMITGRKRFPPATPPLAQPRLRHPLLALALLALAAGLVWLLVNRL